jgi:hypothetical protein
VEVTRPEVRPECVDVNRQHPRNVRRIDQCQHAAVATSRDDTLDGHDRRGLGGDVLDDDEAGPPGERIQQAPDDLVWRRQGKRYRNDPRARAGNPT